MLQDMTNYPLYCGPNGPTKEEEEDNDEPEIVKKELQYLHVIAFLIDWLICYNLHYRTKFPLLLKQTLVSITYQTQEQP
jgi:hypothetical protein